MASVVRIHHCFLFLLALAHIACSHVLVKNGANDTNLERIVLSQLVEKRDKIPSNRTPRYFDHAELRDLHTLCLEAANYVQQYDFWFFVGNSGGYLAYCFEHERMKPIPISKARKYHRFTPRESDPKDLGEPLFPYWYSIREKNDLFVYWNRYLKDKVKNLRIDRIVLVDHSSSGRSVEATKLILKEAFSKGEQFQRFRNVQWALFNLVDVSRQTVQGGQLEWNVRDPDGFGHVRKASVPGAQRINRLVGDEAHHDRVQANYWPARWHKTVQEIWEKDGGFPQAKLMRQQIRDYVISQEPTRTLLKPVGFGDAQ